MDKITSEACLMLLRQYGSTLTAAEIAILFSWPVNGQINTTSRAVATALRYADRAGQVRVKFRRGGAATYRFVRMTKSKGI